MNLMLLKREYFQWVTLHRFAWCSLLVLALWHVSVALKQPSAEHLPDVVATYAPAGKYIVDHGLTAFLRDPSSIRIPLLVSLWFGLSGGNPDLVQSINAWMSAGSIILAGFVGLRLGGLLGMISGSLLWAFSPLITRYTPTALVEPSYWFLAWAWLATSILYWETRQRKWVLAVGLLGGLCCAMRPLLLYPFFFTAISALVWTRLPSRFSIWATRARFVAATTLSPLIIPVVFMTVNAVHHQVFALSTGAGAALYLGLHPIVGGVDPPHFGFGYDVPAVVGGEGDHLSILGDRRLRAAALDFAHDRSAREWVRTALHKARLTLFLGPEERLTPEYQHWRILLVVTALLGFFLHAQSWRATVIGFVGLLSFLQTLPLLHNTRYTAGAMEIFLTIGASLAFSALFGKLRVTLSSNAASLHFSLYHTEKKLLPNLLQITAVCVIGWFAFSYAVLYLGNLALSQSNPLIIRKHAFFMGHVDFSPQASRSDEAFVTREQWVTGTAGKFAANYRVAKKPDYGSFDGNMLWVFELEAVGVDGVSCRNFSAAFIPDIGHRGIIQTRAFTIPNNRKSHQISLSANLDVSPLHLSHAGDFRIIADCPAGSRFRLKGLTHRVSQIPENARAEFAKKYVISR